MAAASYVSNLTDITLSETSSGYTAIGGGGALQTAETDFYIQGNACLSKATNNTWDSSGTPRGGAIYNNNTGITVPTDGAVLFWIYWWGPGVLATKANGGAELNIGSATTAYKSWYVTGSDDWQFGGWRCYPLDPTVATDRANTGNPTATLQYFGWQAFVAATVNIGRGNPYGIDAIRYGRCDLIATNGDLANGYATFLAMANYDNDVTRRYGLLTPRDGAYYQQGLLQLGTSVTPVDFRDSNRTIFVQNTEKVSSNFNKIEIINASSRVDWDSISITALGTVAKGNFEVVTSNATVNITSCSFTSLGTFIFKAGSTISSSVYRNCSSISLNGAIFSSNTVSNSSATSSLTITGSDLANVTKNIFSRATNTNHAVSFPASGGTTNITWDNTLSGYVAGSAGSNVGTTSGTGNEAIYITGSTTSTINITVAAGATIPSIRKDSANVTVNVTANQLTFTITNIKSGTELRAYTYTTESDPTTYTEFVGAEVISGSPVSSTFNSITYVPATDSYTATKTYDGGTAIPLVIVAHNLDYQFFRTSITLSSSQDTSLQLFQISDRNYDEGATPYV